MSLYLVNRLLFLQCLTTIITTRTNNRAILQTIRRQESNHPKRTCLVTILTDTQWHFSSKLFPWNTAQAVAVVAFGGGIRAATSTPVTNGSGYQPWMCTNLSTMLLLLLCIGKCLLDDKVGSLFVTFVMASIAVFKILCQRGIGALSKLMIFLNWWFFLALLIFQTHPLRLPSLLLIDLSRLLWVDRRALHLHTRKWCSCLGG